jgi:sigma-E factor negative regulatory protein RseA
MDKISAWMDGELDEQQAQQQFSRLKHDADLRNCWDEFHLIGDALRGEFMLSQQFSQRLTDRLAHEPTVLAPRRSGGRRVIAYALSAAASLCAIGLVGWVALSGNPSTPWADFARGPAAPSPATIPATLLANVPSDGKMNEYLIAHQEFSPSTTIQGLAPYIRSVSSTRSAKGR